MNSLIKNIFFKNTTVQTFFISRLLEKEVEEKVYLKTSHRDIDITGHHAMICLDPFCIAVWLSNPESIAIDPYNVKIKFKKGNKLNATINASIIEKMPTEKGVLLLYRIEKVKNYQLSPFHRLALFAWFLRSKKNTYYSRRVISALYS